MHAAPCLAPAAARQEVWRLIEVLGRDGGYVVAPAHEMQDDILPENIAAWVETVDKYGKGKFGE